MLEDQEYILDQILELAGRYRPDGILLAGDLYDRQMPSAEAVQLADRFLTGLSSEGIPLWGISGNHDCPERVAYASQMLDAAGIHLSRVFDGALQRYTIQKSKRERADLYLLPFVRPAQVRGFFPDRTIETTEQAVEAILSLAEPEKDRPNLLLMHQFITGASVCESEERSVGGTDEVSADVLRAFDYVALGHLHGPQDVERETVRYCGSPLKYSFSEANQKKSVTVVDIDFSDDPSASDAKPWEIRISTLPLKPLHDLREIRGPIDALLDPEVYKGTDCGDYMHVTLTDKEGVLDAVNRLREVYPNLMRLDFETDVLPGIRSGKILTREKTPEELFEEFFEMRMGEPMNEKQQKAAEEAWES